MFGIDGQKIRMREIIYVIDGGIGHALNSTLALGISKRKRGSASIVLTSWPEIFHNNPDVKAVYNIMNQPAEIAALFTDVGRNYFMHKDNIYTDRSHLANPNRHIKHLICEKYNLDWTSDDQLLRFFPTVDEKAETFKWFREKIEEKGYEPNTIFALMQPEGSGIGSNPAAALKAMPVKLTKAILDALPDNVLVFHMKLPGENPIDHPKVIPLQGLSARKVITLSRFFHFGFGCESLGNHIMAGLYNRPFVAFMGRSNPGSYMHPKTVVVSDPGSCAHHRCEMPFYSVARICERTVCMDAISHQKAIEAVLRQVSDTMKHGIPQDIS